MSPKIARKSENKRRSAVLESKLQEFEIGKIIVTHIKHRNMVLLTTGFHEFSMLFFFLEENNNIKLIN